MKNFKFYLLGAVVLAAVLYAEHAMAMSIAVQPTTVNLIPVVDEVPKDDDREEPDDGYECEDVYPSCEAHLD